MMKKILILITLILIIEKHKGVQCQSNITDIPTNEILSDIRNVSIKLLRVNGWKKYLLDHWMIWRKFITLKDWTKYPTDSKIKTTIWNEANSLLNSLKYINKDIKIPRVTEPSAALESVLQNQFIQNEAFVRTTPPTPLPLESTYGPVLLLMKQEDFNEFSKMTHIDDKLICLVKVIFDALEDIYKGILHIIRKIENIKKKPLDTEIDLVKFMEKVFHNAVNITELLYYTRNIKSVYGRLGNFSKDAPRTTSHYTYSQFIKVFKKIYANKINDSGRIIKNEAVNPSIIEYYRIYEDPTLKLNGVDFYNADPRMVFLMEINAWIFVLHPILRNLHDTLYQNANKEYRKTVNLPNFKEDKYAITFELQNLTYNSDFVE